MKLAIIGKSGQLARTLSETAPPGTDLTLLGRDAADLASPGAADRALRKIKPDAVVIAAAYTAVDRAESESELAHRINGDAVGEIGASCKSLGARCVHISTDFVFGGSASGPRRTDEPCAPLSVYGASKLLGERLLAESGVAHCILRTAWLYRRDGANFLTTMLRLMREREALTVVCDQIGTPTTCHSLTTAIWGALETDLQGTWHCTDAGAASWYDFACAIQRLAIESGALDRTCEIQPIPTTAYPTPAARPSYSVLDCQATWQALDISPLWWQQALRNEMAASGGTA